MTKPGDRYRAAVHNLYRCPDCINRNVLTKFGDGVYTLQVEHDDTCPSQRAHTS